MLHKETVTRATLDLLRALMQDENIDHFFLAGGTALSLQIGHRMSIDIDLFSQKTFDENELSSIEDIAAMKLNAIVGNGTRLKDFIDIAYVSNFLSLYQMIHAYEHKYASRNPLMVLKSLAYHKEINHDEPIRMINSDYKWDAISNRLDERAKFPDKVFQSAPVH